MAIWQYNFTVIPKNGIEKGNFISKKYLDEDGFLEDEPIWLRSPTKMEIFDAIEKILPRNESWSKNISLFGDQDSNRFEVYRNEVGSVISVSFRIDFQSGYDQILENIINFLDKHDMLILDEKMQLLKNDFDEVKSEIEGCEQRIAYKKLSNGNDS